MAKNPNNKGKWSDSKAWRMTLLSALIVALVAALAAYLLNRPKPSPIFQTATDHSTAIGTQTLAPGAVGVLTQNGATNVGVNTGTINVQNEKPIPGTNFTRTQVEEMYPFGYVVYSRSTGQKWTYDYNPPKHGKWIADWDKTGIEILPGQKWVRWTFTQRIEFLGSGWGRILMHDNFFEYDAPFKVGAEMRVQGGRASDPAIYVRTLGDNQATPVMVLGFRIP